MTIPNPEEDAILADLYGDIGSEEFEAAHQERVKDLLFGLDMDGKLPGML